jgi:hypothetical protein
MKSAWSFSAEEKDLGSMSTLWRDQRSTIVGPGQWIFMETGGEAARIASPPAACPAAPSPCEGGGPLLLG